MSTQPTFAVRVADLAATVTFYAEYLGQTLGDHNPRNDTAIIINGLDMPILFVGPKAGELVRHMGQLQEVATPGSTLYLFDPDPRSRQFTLARHGLTDTQLLETRWGELRLILWDPDGYKVSLWNTLERTPQEVLALYMQAPIELEVLLSDLKVPILDLPRQSGEWTIRQIVHHFIDADIMLLGRMRMALADPGQTWFPISNAYSPQMWADKVGDYRLAIEPSVKLFRAVREHIYYLLTHLPTDAWERYTVNAQGERTTVGWTIRMLTNHALEHIDEIRDICQLHAS
jgi:catechol 2,3-dioxygenase-like lactoylglutathione lyase family enzyme